MATDASRLGIRQAQTQVWGPRCPYLSLITSFSRWGHWGKDAQFLPWPGLEWSPEAESWIHPTVRERGGHQLLWQYVDLLTVGLLWSRCTALLKTCEEKFIWKWALRKWMILWAKFVAMQHGGSFNLDRKLFPVCDHLLHATMFPSSPIRAILSSGLRWRWNKWWWIISGATTVLLCSPPLQQGTRYYPWVIININTWLMEQSKTFCFGVVIWLMKYLWLFVGYKKKKPFFFNPCHLFPLKLQVYSSTEHLSTSTPSNLSLSSSDRSHSEEKEDRWEGRGVLSPGDGHKHLASADKRADGHRGRWEHGTRESDVLIMRTKLSQPSLYSQNIIVSRIGLKRFLFQKGKFYRGLFTSFCIKPMSHSKVPPVGCFLACMSDGGLYIAHGCKHKWYIHSAFTEASLCGAEWSEPLNHKRETGYLRRKLIKNHKIPNKLILLQFSNKIFRAAAIDYFINLVKALT